MSPGPGEKEQRPVIGALFFFVAGNVLSFFV